MSDPTAGFFDQMARGQWVRLRTLIVLRWIAIAGQTLAIVAAQLWFGFDLELGLCALAVGASVLANAIAIFVYPENKRLSETDAMLTLLFDIAQLAFLLYLTGGLHNPFALLILAPVTISATALPMRPTLLLGAIALVLVTLLGLYHLPLRTAEGAAMRLPALFLFGFWVAIMIGIVFLGAYAHRVSSESGSMADALLATQMALAREQKLTDLGGVVAAAAHELGTPLATIRLTSTELIEELADRPDLRADAELLREQADRCRDIMRSMGQAGAYDPQMQAAPLQAVVEEAAAPHRDRGKALEIDLAAGPDGVPGARLVRRRPEVIHGLRNLIQNAVDFADRTVWIDGAWVGGRLRISITDDGPGYPPHLLGRIGEPFLRSRQSAEALPRGPEYEGMGLGLFIAKTLLEHSGAEVHFANGAQRGARVEVGWPESRMDPAGQEGQAQADRATALRA